jgi:hypothetical protein
MPAYAWASWLHLTKAKGPTCLLTWPSLATGPFVKHNLKQRLRMAGLETSSSRLGSRWCLGIPAHWPISGGAFCLSSCGSARRNIAWWPTEFLLALLKEGPLTALDICTESLSLDRSSQSSPCWCHSWSSTCREGWTNPQIAKSCQIHGKFMLMSIWSINMSWVWSGMFTPKMMATMGCPKMAIAVRSA